MLYCANYAAAAKAEAQTTRLDAKRMRVDCGLGQPAASQPAAAVHQWGGKGPYSAL